LTHLSHRKTVVVMTVAVGLAIVVAAPAFSRDVYELSGVKRVDQDLYKTLDRIYIETQYCYHYTYGEDAILKWEGKYGDNKIIWEDDSSCRVKSIWKK
jgi:hypothetical protein